MTKAKPTPAQEKKHWWLNDKPFKRVRMSTLYRLGLLYQAKTGNSVHEFLLWLDDGGYIEFDET